MPPRRKAEMDVSETDGTDEDTGGCSWDVKLGRMDPPS